MKSSIDRKQRPAVANLGQAKTRKTRVRYSFRACRVHGVNTPGICIPDSGASDALAGEKTLRALFKQQGLSFDEAERRNNTLNFSFAGGGKQDANYQVRLNINMRSDTGKLLQFQVWCYVLDGAGSYTPVLLSSSDMRANNIDMHFRAECDYLVFKKHKVLLNRSSSGLPLLNASGKDLEFPYAAKVTRRTERQSVSQKQKDEKKLKRELDRAKVLLEKEKVRAEKLLKREERKVASQAKKGTPSGPHPVGMSIV